MKDVSYFDVLIIGGGIAGISAAKKAAQKGLKTALIEMAFLGGTCANSGCYPTKFFLYKTHTRYLAEQSGFLATESSESMLTRLQEEKKEFLTGLRERTRIELEKTGVSIFSGRASFIDPVTVQIQQGSQAKCISFSHCILATGSRPFFPSQLSPDNKHVHNAVSALNWTKVPEHLILIGAGPICIEIGETMSRLGSRITLLERLPRILPQEEDEVADSLLQHLRSRSWDIRTGVDIASAKTKDDKAVVTFKNGEELVADYALLGLGRMSNTMGLGLENTPISFLPNKAIQTNDYLEAAPNVYAIGDCNGKTLLANYARHQAEFIIDNILSFTPKRYEQPQLPACIYGSIECLRVGQAERELRKSPGTIVVKKYPFSQSIMSMGAKGQEGLVKMTWVNNLLQSVSAVGPGASHLASTASLLIESKKVSPEGYIPHFAHPTFEEILQENIDLT